MSIFPQFVDFTKDYNNQFIVFVITKMAKFSKGGKAVNGFGGGTFVFFGIGLASASK